MAQIDIAVAQAQRVVDRTCRRCHNDGTLAGNLSLAGFDVAHPERQPAVTEKIIRKLAAGMMPPAGAARPAEAVLAGLADTLAARIDAVSAASPNPGRRTFQRLNRSEYARSVRDLLDLEVDVAAFLPPDTLSHGFDNIADVQTLVSRGADLHTVDRRGRNVSDWANGPIQRLQPFTETLALLAELGASPHNDRCVSC